MRWLTSFYHTNRYVINITMLMGENSWSLENHLADSAKESKFGRSFVQADLSRIFYRKGANRLNLSSLSLDMSIDANRGVLNQKQNGKQCSS